MLATGLPFSPVYYTVWRNYARVFGCALLAAKAKSTLIITDLCRKLADESDDAWEEDDYFTFLMPRFYFPSPVFDGYTSSGKRVFPFCAVLKLLLARQKAGKEPKVTPDEVFGLLIGNEIAGTEPLEFYQGLNDSGYRPRGDEQRQLREMLIFVSQCSFLKWQGTTLFLDLLPGAEDALAYIEEVARPMVKIRKPFEAEEILAIGSVKDALVPAGRAAPQAEFEPDMIITEGKRRAVTHLRIERSPRLRSMFFERLHKPVLCDACKLNAEKKYPWPNSIIEIHHLLPLASGIAVTGRGVALSDLRPICANCHKGIHAYYRLWLRREKKSDFSDFGEASSVYGEAKNLII
jgi:hypothetical protein